MKNSENKDLPAFPTSTDEWKKEDVDAGFANGLSKREYFAAMAMQGLLACNATYGGATNDYKSLAKDSLSCADALLSALEQQGN
jgi:hypothetical protein